MCSSITLKKKKKEFCEEKLLLSKIMNVPTLGGKKQKN